MSDCKFTALSLLFLCCHRPPLLCSSSSPLPHHPLSRQSINVFHPCLPSMPSISLPLLSPSCCWPWAVVGNKLVPSRATLFLFIMHCIRSNLDRVLMVWIVLIVLIVVGKVYQRHPSMQNIHSIHHCNPSTDGSHRPLIHDSELRVTCGWAFPQKGLVGEGALGARAVLSNY